MRYRGGGVGHKGTRESGEILAAQPNPDNEDNDNLIGSEDGNDAVKEAQEEGEIDSVVAQGRDGQGSDDEEMEGDEEEGSDVESNDEDDVEEEAGDEGDQDDVDLGAEDGEDPADPVEDEGYGVL